MNANTYSAPAALGGNREDLRNVLTILEPEDTPFTSMCKKGPSPKATFTEVLGDTLRKPRKTGTKEGNDAGKGGNKATKRARFGTYCHRVMDEFGVTDVQELVSERGGVAAISNEYGEAKAKCVREVKRDIESVCCSDIEHQGGSDAEMQTRGAFTWIQNSAQSANPVPSDFRALSGAILSGVGVTTPLFTEAQLNGILKALKTVYGGKKEFDCIAGNNVIETVDNFTRTQSSTTNSRYHVYEMADEHEITLMVQVFDSSFGRVNMIPTEFNKIDSTGVGDPNAALILNMMLWELQFLDALHSADLPELGGGPNGYVKALFANTCLSPRGNGKIYNT